MQTRRMSGGWAERGFTLVEVLCAVAVLSIALLASFRLINQQTRVAAGLNERVFAHWVALNALEERRLGIPAGFGDATQTLGGIDWQIAQSEAPGPAGLTRVELRVASEGHAGALLVGYLPPDRGRK